MKFVLESCRQVVDSARDVKIDEHSLKLFAQSFVPTRKSPVEFGKHLSKEQFQNFIFVVDSLAFCFWGMPKWRIHYHDTWYDGYYGLVFALLRSLEDGIAVADARVLGRLTIDEVKYLFRGEQEIPLLTERHRILNELGTVLDQQYRGEFSNIIAASKGDALSLLDIIVKYFSFFDDVAEYGGRKVLFFKRAQLLVSYIHDFVQPLKNVDQLTACADYKIPQVLRKHGILVYSERLAAKVDNRVELLGGSPEEVEIRACMVWAVHRLWEVMRTNHQEVALGHALWSMSQIKSSEDKPYHLTRTSAY